MSAFTDTARRAVTTAKRTSGKGRPAHHNLLLHAVLLVCAIAMALPFAWMLFSSFKPLGEIFMQPPKLLPQDWNVEGYRTAFSGNDFVRGFWNSTYIAVSVTAVSLLTSAMAAYAFARIDFWGSRGLFMVLLGVTGLQLAAQKRWVFYSE